jgi:hypothetical protein
MIDVCVFSRTPAENDAVEGQASQDHTNRIATVVVFDSPRNTCLASCVKVGCESSYGDVISAYWTMDPTIALHLMFKCADVINVHQTIS